MLLAPSLLANATTAIKPERSEQDRPLDTTSNATIIINNAIQFELKEGSDSGILLRCCYVIE